MQSDFSNKMVGVVIGIERIAIAFGTLTLLRRKGGALWSVAYNSNLWICHHLQHKRFEMFWLSASEEAELGLVTSLPLEQTLSWLEIVIEICRLYWEI